MGRAGRRTSSTEKASGRWYMVEHGQRICVVNRPFKASFHFLKQTQGKNAAEATGDSSLLLWQQQLASRCCVLGTPMSTAKCGATPPYQLDLPASFCHLLRHPWPSTTPLLLISSHGFVCLRCCLPTQRLLVCVLCASLQNFQGAPSCKISRIPGMIRVVQSRLRGPKIFHILPILSSCFTAQTIYVSQNIQFSPPQQ